MTWKLFGRKTTPAQLPAELRSILAQMQRERVAFEALTTGARDSTQQLTQLTQPIAEAQKVVAELQGRVKALERLVPVLATLDEQTEGVSRTQRRTETQVEHTAEDVKNLRTEIEQLRATFDAALALKGDLMSLLESAGSLTSLRADADALTGQVHNLSNTFDRARQRQDELSRAGEAAAARLHAFEERQQQAQGGIAAAQTRVTGLEQAFAHLGQAAADAADTKRQLGTLKSLADYVTQKVAVLEQQREVVDRTIGQATQLDDVLRDIDAKIQKHEASAEHLGALETRVTELQTLHGDLLARSGEISARHDQIVQTDRELYGRLNGLRDEAQQTVKRFEGDAGQLVQTVEQMTERVARLEQAQPAFDAALRDFASLRGTHQEVKDALERMRLAEGEIARVREAQAGTKTWLGDVAESVTGLRGELAAVEEMRPTVESGRSEERRVGKECRSRWSPYH